MDGEWERTVRSMASDPTRPLTILDRGSVNELFAEIDRLRALPVLATCGPCRHLTSNPARVGLYCAEEKRALEADAEGRPVAPPTWCPLRGVQCSLGHLQPPGSTGPCEAPTGPFVCGAPVKR